MPSGNNKHFGIIGLGTMGAALAENAISKGIPLSVYNRMAEGEEGVVDAFLNKHENATALQGFTDLNEFVRSLSQNRVILMMIPAGSAVDALLEQLIPLCSKGDVLIDAGNSHFKDTIRRQQTCTDQGIHFIGLGVSGGEKGARTGPSMMAGCTEEAYELAKDYLLPLPAKDKQGKACCGLVSKNGAGHFVKMIHNGIEYAEMQLIAEVFQLLSKQHSYAEIASLLEEWNQGESESYLLGITSKILRKKEGEAFVIDLISDEAGSKGTGVWSSETALEVAYPATLIQSAVNARLQSKDAEERKLRSQKVKSIHRFQQDELDIKKIHQAYEAARWINHIQGFELITKAAEHYEWKIELSELSRIWTNGCIIRSKLMEECSRMFSSINDLIELEDLFRSFEDAETAFDHVLSLSLQHRLSLPAFTAARDHWLTATSHPLGTRLIQAQRDFFGTHGYHRMDEISDNLHHTNWEE